MQKTDDSENVKKMERNRGATSLLNEIRRVSLQIETSTLVCDALDEANAMYYTYIQGDEERNAKHLRNCESIIENVEHLGGTIFVDDTLTIY